MNSIPQNINQSLCKLLTKLKLAFYDYPKQYGKKSQNSFHCIFDNRCDVGQDEVPIKVRYVVTHNLGRLRSGVTVIFHFQSFFISRFCQIYLPKISFLIHLQQDKIHLAFPLYQVRIHHIFVEDLSESFLYKYESEFLQKSIGQLRLNMLHLLTLQDLHQLMARLKKVFLTQTNEKIIESTYQTYGHFLTNHTSI